MKKYKWHMDTDEITSAKVYWYGPFRGLTNVFYHAIEIYSERVKNRFSGTYRTRHTIKIAFGPYGEAGETEVLPFGTRIKEAKQKALVIAEQAIANGYEFKE